MSPLLLSIVCVLSIACCTHATMDLAERVHLPVSSECFYSHSPWLWDEFVLLLDDGVRNDATQLAHVIYRLTAVLATGRPLCSGLASLTSHPADAKKQCSDALGPLRASKVFHSQDD